MTRPAWSEGPRGEGGRERARAAMTGAMATRDDGGATAARSVGRPVIVGSSAGWATSQAAGAATRTGWRPGRGRAGSSRMASAMADATKARTAADTKAHV